MNKLNSQEMDRTVNSQHRKLLAGLALVGAIFACTLPGTSSPTPFVIPTADVTLTAMFSETEDRAPTQPPITLGPGSSPTPSPTVILGAVSSTPVAGGTTTPISQDTRPNGIPVEAAFIDTPPTLDGDLGEWSSSTFNANKVVFGASNWTGASDASGVYYIGWTNEALYIAIAVTDDTFVQVSSGSSLYKGDEVELQIDTNLKGDFFSNILSSDDYQIGLSPGNFGTLGKESWRWYPRSTRGPLSVITIHAKSRSDGYDMEAKIPWSVFGLTPSEGARYGFALSVSDNDLKGAPVQQSMVSSVSSRTLSNPTTWGTLILGE
ncbi:MAG: sugar-binding protein [Anaerolineales bacterium]